MMDIVSYYKSISDELSTLKSRIRDIMEEPHWVTDGEWKESVLRTVLRRYLPETLKVGRGFIVTHTHQSHQLDILIYDASYPVLFKDGDLVFVTPDAVRGVIEVKSKVTTAILREAFMKLTEVATLVNAFNSDYDERPRFIGLFSYDTTHANDERVLGLLCESANMDIHKVITHLSLGKSSFFRFWAKSPDGTTNKWHSYHLTELAPAYFITNLIEWVSPQSVNSNNNVWFPQDSKERRKTGDRGLL